VGSVSPILITCGKSVFSVPDGRSPPLLGPKNILMPDIVINEAGDLNPFKATGPDGVSSRFLKEFEIKLLLVSPSLCRLLYINHRCPRIGDMH